MQRGGVALRRRSKGRSQNSGAPLLSYKSEAERRAARHKRVKGMQMGEGKHESKIGRERAGRRNQAFATVSSDGGEGKGRR